MESYFLPKHVFFCGRGDALVFLDLKNDQYLMIRDAVADEFKKLIGMSPKPTANSNCQSHGNDDPRSVNSLLSDILNAGLITTSPYDTKEILPTEVESPEVLLTDLENTRNVRIGPLDAWRVFASCTKAALWLRSRSLQNIVRSVSVRNAQRPRELDFEKAIRCVRVFNRLRSLFPANYLCLFDSLALLLFLARYGVFPSWVFAVQIDPWGAHCWVQDGRVSFNQDIEEAQDYMPVMVA